jgi:hypothetical protein
MRNVLIFNTLPHSRLDVRSLEWKSWNGGGLSGSLGTAAAAEVMDLRNEF